MHECTFLEVVFAPVLLRHFDIVQKLLLLGRSVDSVGRLARRNWEAPTHYGINVLL